MGHIFRKRITSWDCLRHEPLLLDRTVCLLLYAMWSSFGYFSTVLNNFWLIFIIIYLFMFSDIPQLMLAKSSKMFWTLSTFLMMNQTSMRPMNWEKFWRTITWRPCFRYLFFWIIFLNNFWINFLDNFLDNFRDNFWDSFGTISRTEINWEKCWRTITFFRPCFRYHFLRKILGQILGTNARDKFLGQINGTILGTN